MVTLQVKQLRSHREKIKGLIGAKEIVPVYFTTRFGIHTFGMSSPIDVVILTDDMKVATYISDLPPNRIFHWNPGYRHVIELPAGTIQKNQITKGTPVTLDLLTD